MKINTKEYWENRFASGDWEVKQGRLQTEAFARGQVPYLELGNDFEGTILDFGCGLGDAMPIYRENFPKAKLIGVDISANAISKCRMKYGSMATFTQADYNSVPEVDVIIASNVLEHLSNDREVAQALLHRCKDLYVFVPYDERPLCSEHVNTYGMNHFRELGKYTYKVFACKGWTPHGKDLWWGIYLKNIVRPLLGRQILRRGMQIMFHFKREG